MISRTKEYIQMQGPRENAQRKKVAKGEGLGKKNN